MIVKKVCGKVIGAHLTSAEQKAMRIEIEKELAQMTVKHARELDALILYHLREEFGFGPGRLKRFYHGFNEHIQKLCDRYEMHEQEERLWLCTRMLKEDGIDIEQWEKEGSD